MVDIFLREYFSSRSRSTACTGELQCNTRRPAQFTIAELRFVRLKIYDLLGREVGTLENNLIDPGMYSVMWDASGVSSGVYYYRLSAGEFSETKKLIITK